MKKVVVLVLVVIALGLAYYSLRTAFKFTEVENIMENRGGGTTY